MGYSMLLQVDRARVTSRTMPEPTSTLSEIANIASPMLTSDSSPDPSSVAASVMPMNPSAPGTRIQSAGNIVTADDGPLGTSSIARVSGMMIRAPTNPDSSGDNNW